MAVKKICRICLCTNTKMYRYDRFHLKQYYEQITCIKESESDWLPQYFCYECAMMLYKYYKFQQKCFLGREALKIIQSNGEIKYDSLYLIDRSGLKLKSSVQILEKSKRVKTYVVKYSPNKKAIPRDAETKKEDQIEVVEDPVENIVDDEKVAKTDVTDHVSQPETDDQDSDNEPLIKINRPFINDVKPKEEIFVATVENIQELLDLDTPDFDDHYEEPKLEDDFVKDTVKRAKRKKMTNKRKREKIEKMYENSKFYKRRKRNLDPLYWKKYNLTEEEAMKEFQAKSQCKKYLVARFKCTDCFKPFLVEETLSRHMELIHKESLGPEECRFCHMRFKWRCYLSRHTQKHYTRFQCQRCSFICNVESTAYLHDETHSDVKIKCKYCEEEFRHRSTYYTHLRTHRSEHVCALCGASFVSQAGLHMHKKLKHVTDDSEKVPQNSSTFCEKCDITFDSQMAYEAHLLHSAMHPGGESGILNDTAPDEETHNLKLNKKKGPRRKPTTCYQCGKHFDSQTACFKHHLATHPGTSFNSPEERQICEFCGASLAPGSVANHLNSHTRSKLHTCDTCGRQFSTKMVLKRHLLTHTGEKPFGCSLCEKRFTQPSSLQLHFRTFHLKQPYPKRNRKKKSDLEDFRMELESDGSR